MAKRESGPSTRLIHPERGDSELAAGVSPVLDRSSTFRLDEVAEEALATRVGHDRFDSYGRFGTQTTREAAKLVAQLEGAEAACLFSSGMAAIASALIALAKPGTRVLASHDVYGGSEALLTETLPARGVIVERFDACDPSTLASLLKDRDAAPVSLVFCESISNPLLRVAAIEALAKLAHGASAKLVVDATFTAGIASRPLERGADLVLHSATKFLNGHSDVIAGAVAGAAELVDPVFREMTLLGGCIDPGGAWLLARGMRTLVLRFGQQSASTTELARRLKAHPKVLRVYHPSLEGHESAAIAKVELDAGGGVLSFELADGGRALAFSRALKLCAFAVSLGGLETLVAIPRRSSHVGYTPEHWDSVGIHEGLVRVAVGLEDVEDIWADIEQALA